MHGACISVRSSMVGERNNALKTLSEWYRAMEQYNCRIKRDQNAIGLHCMWI